MKERGLINFTRWRKLSLSEDWRWWSGANADTVNILLSTHTCAGWSSHPPMKACLAAIRLTPGAFYCLADLGLPIPLWNTSSFLTGRARTWNTSNGSGRARCSKGMQTSLFFHHLYSVGDDQTAWEKNLRRRFGLEVYAGLFFKIPLPPASEGFLTNPKQVKAVCVG